MTEQGEPAGKVILSPAPAGKSPMDFEADRNLFAMVLNEAADPRGFLAGGPEHEHWRRNVWYALGLAAQLGYDVGLDFLGFAHIRLPVEPEWAGDLRFPLGHLNTEASPSISWAKETSERARRYIDAVVRRAEDRVHARSEPWT